MTLQVQIASLLRETLKGGQGSGNFNHAGRPGKVGGSQPQNGETSPYSGPVGGGGLAAGEYGVNPIDLLAGHYGPESRPSPYWDEHKRVIEEMTKAGRLVRGMTAISWASPTPHEFIDTTAMQKVHNADVLADRLKIDPEDYQSRGFISQTLSNWARDNKGPWMTKFQEAVAQEFNLPIPRYIQRRLEKTHPENMQLRDWNPVMARKLARAIYDETQSTLRRMGIKEGEFLVLYRGMNRTTLTNIENKVYPGPENRTYSYFGNPIESWTLDRRTAMKFGRTRARMAVRASNIFSSSLSGIGCLGEMEFLIFGSEEGLHAEIIR